MKPIAQFKVYPAQSGLIKVFTRSSSDTKYFEVKIFENDEQMWLNMEKDYPEFPEVHRGFWAATVKLISDSQNKNGKIIKNKVGELYFCKECLGAEITTHESVHAGFHYVNLLMTKGEIKDDSEIDEYVILEELISDISGVIAQQIVDKCHKYNLYA